MTTTLDYVTDTRLDGSESVLNERITSDDPEKASHIVPVPPEMAALYPEMTPQAYIMDARVNGYPVTALCGYTWVPQQDPAALPICSGCYDLYMAGADKYGDRDKLPDA